MSCQSYCGCANEFQVSAREEPALLFHIHLTATAARHLSPLPIDAWWRCDGPGLERRGSRLQVMVIHLWEDAPILPSLPGPLEFEGSMWAAGEESIHHVTHSSMLQPQWSWLPEPHLTPHHKYNYTLFQPPYAKLTLRTFSSPSQQGSEDIHRLPPQGQMKDTWRLEMVCIQLAVLHAHLQQLKIFH